MLSSNSTHAKSEVTISQEDSKIKKISFDFGPPPTRKREKLIDHSDIIRQIIPNPREDAKRWFEEKTQEKSEKFRNKIMRYFQPINYMGPKS